MKNRILIVWNFPGYIRAQSKEETVLHNGAASSAMGYRDTTVIREGPPRETVLSAQQPATEGRKAAIIHPRNPDLHPAGGGIFFVTASAVWHGYRETARSLYWVSCSCRSLCQSFHQPSFLEPVSWIIFPGHILESGHKGVGVKQVLHLSYEGHIFTKNRG